MSLSLGSWADMSTAIPVTPNSSANSNLTASDNTPPDTEELNFETQQKIENNPFAVSFYEPTYILPFYYTESPDNAVYGNQVPDNQTISNYELKFQFSFKYPLLKFNENHQLYIAYTQLSYWQAYQQSAFFRETDYEPEIFFSNKMFIPLGHGWQTNFLNIGAMHQSNGRGGTLERSWNRIYVNLIGGKGNFMFQVQPWYIINDTSMEDHNPDIAQYMGYEQVIASYKYGDQVFSLQARNTVESAFQRAAWQFTWSFPLGVHNLKGYVQLFSGYGQSLIEYNHYTNALGVGISLSDWQ